MSKKKTDLEKLQFQLDKLEKLYSKVKIMCPDCPWPEYKESGKGCCINCGKDNGYFKISFINDKDINTELLINQKQQLQKLKEKYGFNEKDGFFQIGIGCKLPRSKRSHICNNWTCYNFPKIWVGYTCKRIEFFRKKLNLID